MSRPSLILVALTVALISAWWAWSGPGAVDAAEARPAWTLLMRGDEAGTVSGRILVDDDVPPRRVQLVLEARLVGDRLPILHHLPIEVAEDGTFISPALPACEASLVARLGEVELARLEHLDVPASGACPDPRLEGIDLRGAVRVFDFELFDFAGEPLPFATLGWRPATPEGDPSPYRSTVIGRRGQAQVVCADEWIDVLVAAPGARTREVFGVSFGRELHLREGWPVRIALPEGLDPAADGVELSARLRHVGSEPRAHPDAERLLEALTETPELTFSGGVAEVLLPTTGPWELEWVALIESPAGLRRLDLGAEHPRFEIGGTDWQQLQRPEFPLEAYRAELER